MTLFVQVCSSVLALDWIVLQCVYYTCTCLCVCALCMYKCILYYTGSPILDYTMSGRHSSI